MWNNIGIDNFDLIVDDGLHTFKAAICLFEESISKLSDNGIYVIEDFTISDLLKFKGYFEDKSYQVDYINLFRHNSPLNDNCLIVIRKLKSV